jgi:DNA-damage-inducible protein D
MWRMVKYGKAIFKDNTPMANDRVNSPQFHSTMERLEALRHVTSVGVEFWMAREIHPVLGYEVWARFVNVIGRVKISFTNNGIDSSHHIAQTSKMMGVGRGAQVEGNDFYLSRAACYLLAMNGDPSKAEIAAAQAYFTIKTRERELHEQTDHKRLELREKVTQSHKRVSQVAKQAGLPSRLQGVFHDQRYRGLYGMSLKDLKAMKGLGDKDQLMDRVGPLELSANDFQMNLAADVIDREKIRGEQLVIRKNLELAKKVRATMTESGATMPEHLPIEAPISEVKKKIAGQKKLGRPKR